MENIKDGIYTYSEWVVNDIEKIQQLNALLVDERNEKKRSEINEEILKEKATQREIVYSFPISRIKSNCVDCNISLGETFEQLLKNNLSRGNYCPNCNAKYGKLNY